MFFGVFVNVYTGCFSLQQMVFQTSQRVFFDVFGGQIPVK